jgi:hypothetical protein
VSGATAGKKTPVVSSTGGSSPVSDNSDLRLEAEGIVGDLDLVPLLSAYGRARVVGSVALDLVVKFDIDVHLLVHSDDVLPVVDHVCRQLLNDDRIHEIRLSDHRSRGGVKVGIEEYPGASGNWSIDIWITNSLETTGFDLVDRLKAAIGPQHREVILELKRYYHRRGRLRDGLSALIYEAVVDGGIQNRTEFEQFMRRRDARRSR